MKLIQDKAYEVESYARSYYFGQNGYFSEPFLRATVIAYDQTKTLPVGAPAGQIDVDGETPLYTGIPVTFDCKAGGYNITNMLIKVFSSSYVIVVYWTKYAGFQWQK